jgi:gamma-glutamyltranspeptidase/glutathione hydrolase/leukotriene-C4 hydrolase
MICRPEWRTPVKASLPCDRTLYTSPLPGSGVVLTLILNILGDFLDCSQPSSLTNWQRIVESFKFGFGRRTELGDPSFADFTNVSGTLAFNNHFN